MSKKEIADKADVIIDGFAILKKDNDQYTVVNLGQHKISIFNFDDEQELTDELSNA